MSRGAARLGIADRSAYDLTVHAKATNSSLTAKRDLEAPLRDTVSKHHDLYKTMVLRRLISHVDALKKAADDAVAIRAKVAEELEKL